MYLFRKSPILWIYSAYYTLRYVDKYSKFPAIIFSENKTKNGRLEINDRLILDRWMGSGAVTSITIGNNSRLVVEREFILGEGIKIFVTSNGQLLLKGKEFESGSGITANTVSVVKNYLEVGKDCIIAWNSFLTDCDWHHIEEKTPAIDTIIGGHVWIGVGLKF